MTAFCFDFETFPITPEDQFPRAVCMSFARVEGLQIVDSGVVLYRDGIAMLDHAIRSGWEIVGANTAFDVFVVGCNSDNYEQAVRRWILVYESARVTDVQLRQKLLDGAVDDFLRLKRHSLAAVVEHWTGVKLDKGDGNSEHWRLRFGELFGIPVPQYPRAAYEYALSDAIYTAVVWICQEAARNGWVSPVNRIQYTKNFPGVDILADQYRQGMKALAIKDLSSVGLHANPVTVGKLENQLEEERASLIPTLRAAGLVRREIKLRKAAVAERFRALGYDVPVTEKGAPSLTAKLYNQLVGHPELHACRASRDGWGWPASAEWLADNAPDLVEVTYVKCEERARRSLEFVYLYLDEVPNRTETKVYDPKTRKTEVVLGDVKIDADNCDRSGHPALIAYARYASVVKTLGNDIVLLRQAAKAPFCAHYNPLKDNGRTATGSDGGEGDAGNVQNMPRRPGVRECWESPEGWLFSMVDYSAVELSTFGQVALWWLGWSECARMIQNKVDQHSVMGAALLKIPDPKGAGWKEVKRRKKEGDFAADMARTGGKGMNFGCKARMSAKRYKTYAWNNYGLKLTLEEAQEHINLHNEMIAEMGAYTAKVSTFSRNPGKFGARHDLIHPYSGRVRADLSYTDVHNYPFSGLAQDMAAVALWDLFKAKWGASELGESDPFYHCFPCIFTHDEIGAYVPADINKANAAAKRHAEIMYKASRKVLPDVGSECEPNLQKQLSKKAGDAEVDKATGLIIPFDVWRAAEKDARHKDRPADVSQVDWLKSREWPGYVIRDLQQKGSIC
jgi:hypothetical protein